MALTEREPLSCYPTFWIVQKALDGGEGNLEQKTSCKEAQVKRTMGRMSKFEF